MAAGVAGLIIAPNVITDDCRRTHGPTPAAVTTTGAVSADVVAARLRG